MLLLAKQAIHIVVLRHLPPFIPFLLLLQHFSRQRRRGAVLDAAAVGRSSSSSICLHCSIFLI